MPDIADILDSFPEFRFPADRTSLKPAEIAKKLNCSEDQVIGFVDDGSLHRLAITAKGTREKRSHIRVPVSSYYAFLRRRLSTGWTIKAEPDTAQAEFKF